MKYVIYLRKSTDTEDKQVYSLQDQKSVLTELAEKLQLNVVEVYEESMSAKSPGRPVFDQVIKKISLGKADGLLVWKLDRLARNMADGGMIIDLLQKGVIKSIHTHQQEHTPIEPVYQLLLEFGMANQYVRDLSANVKRGNQEKLKRGDWINKAPFGYLNDRVKKKIVIDSVRSPYVIKMFELYATGLYSYNDIQEQLYLEGLRTSSGKKVYKSIIQRIIHKSFYNGVMESQGKFYQGNHQPLVSKALWDKCQEIAGVTTRPRKQTRGFTLSGFITCADCGCAITAEIKKEKYIYYHCTNGRGGCEQKRLNTREEILHEQIMETFSNIHIDEELVEIIYQAKMEEMESTGEYNTHALDIAREALESIQGKRSRLVDTYLAEQIDKTLYESKLAEFNKQEVDLKNQVKQLEAKTEEPLVTIELTKKAFLDASSLAIRYSKAKNQEKRIILSESLSNSTLKNRELANLSLKSPYDVLAKVPQNADISFLLPD